MNDSSFPVRRRFSGAVVALLLLVAGCSNNDDVNVVNPPVPPDQSVANGVWTGTIGDDDVIAVLVNGALDALSDHSVSSQSDARRYRIAYQAAANETDLSAAAAGVSGHDYATGMALEDLGAFTAVLEVTGMGEDAVTTLEGTLGEAPDAAAVMLTLAAGSTANPTVRDLVAHTWTDATTWTRHANAGGGTTTLTINADLKLDGATAGTGCMFKETTLAPATDRVHAYTAELELEACADADLNGDGYAATVFLGSSDAAAAATTNDVLYLVAHRAAQAASGMTPAVTAASRVFVGRK